MTALFTLLLLAVSVKHDHTALRSACSTDSESLATLPSGATVEIRYAVNGESEPCYKVAFESGGKTIEGYLPGSSLDRLEDFSKGVREAAWLETKQVATRVAAKGGGTGLAGEAARLIEMSQPGKALELLEPAVRARKDPGLMALAGVAAWRSDDSRRALDYWRSSLELQPDPEIERLYRKVEKETRSDQSTDKIVGMRVLVRYDPAVVPAVMAREMAAALDDEFIRISTQLGCGAEERIVAIIQSREAYRKTTDAAEWSGGQFDGRIRVPVLSGQGLDATMRRTLAHETTHACLAMIGNWPAWLHEGLAQKLSGDTLKPALRQKLAQMAHEGKLPRLENLHQDWSRLDAEHAAIAYAMSLAAVEMFFESYREYGIANLLRNPARLGEITADLDKRLGL